LILFFGIVAVINPSRWNQKIGDWGTDFGYYEFSIDHYSKAIHYNSNNASAFNSRGVAYYKLGQHEAAIKDYNRAIELDPQYSLAITNRALSLLILGKAKEAKQDCALACKMGRCVDPVVWCSELKIHCDTGECIGIQSAVQIGICPYEAAKTDSSKSIESKMGEHLVSYRYFHNPKNRTVYRVDAPVIHEKKNTQGKRHGWDISTRVNITRADKKDPIVETPHRSFDPKNPKDEVIVRFMSGVIAILGDEISLQEYEMLKKQYEIHGKK
jgi:hypothetical protein